MSFLTGTPRTYKTFLEKCSASWHDASDKSSAGLMVQKEISCTVTFGRTAERVEGGIRASCWFCCRAPAGKGLGFSQGSDDDDRPSSLSWTVLASTSPVWHNLKHFTTEVVSQLATGRANSHSLHSCDE